MKIKRDRNAVRIVKLNFQKNRTVFFGFRLLLKPPIKLRLSVLCYI